MIYFDSSALVKRYLNEEGSKKVKAIIADSEIIATSKLAYPEILSAFIRKSRNGEVPEKILKRAVNKFETDWDYFIIIDFQNELLSIIKDLILRYPLKGADSIHLSSALWLKHTIKEDITFVASDKTLIDVAQSEMLKVINPQKN